MVSANLSRPQRLRVNHILEDLRPLVEARIHELFKLGIINHKRVKVNWEAQVLVCDL